jgi:hypothetical protein
MTRKERKNINSWIEERKKELQKAKVKFTDYALNDWIEIPDYKIAELNNFQRFFNKKSKRNNLT